MLGHHDDSPIQQRRSGRLGGSRPLEATALSAQFLAWAGQWLRTQSGPHYVCGILAKSWERLRHIEPDGAELHDSPDRYATIHHMPLDSHARPFKIDAHAESIIPSILPTVNEVDKRTVQSSMAQRFYRKCHTMPHRLLSRFRTSFIPRTYHLHHDPPAPSMIKTRLIRMGNHTIQQSPLFVCTLYLPAVSLS